MSINLGSGGLRQKRSSDEDIDPMATVANISDAMLVFACGLMVALISYWNIDVGPATSSDSGVEVEVDESQEMVEVEDIDELSEELSGGTGYTELGTVYQDPTTGKMYMLVEDDDGEDSEDSSDGTDGSDEDSDSAESTGEDAEGSE